MMIESKTGRNLGGKSRRTSQGLGDDEKDETPQVYKSRVMAHDIHRVRELSALLEERRRYFDGQLGEVYRNAGVSSPNNSLPRLRGMESPPVSATPSDSNVTGMSLMGSNDVSHHNRHHQRVDSTDVQSACSGRSYSVFADDECSVVDPFEFPDRGSSKVGGRNWKSTSTLAGSPGGKSQGKRSSFSKDTIHNEVMRTADLEKKLKARRSSLPLALEASLKRPLKKKLLLKSSKDNIAIKRDKAGRSSTGGRGTAEENLSAIASTLLTKDHGYPDSSSDSDEEHRRRFGGSDDANSDRAKHGDRFSMTEILKETRKFDFTQDLRASTSTEFANGNPLLIAGLGGKGKTGKDRRISWDTEIMGVAPRIRSRHIFGGKNTGGSKSASSTVAPMLEYSPRSSLSTLSGTNPKIAFQHFEKMYREEGDKSKLQLHPSSLLLKPVPKIDMNLFGEPTNAEPDYSHDFRYLSLLDALVPCFEPPKAWRPSRTRKTEDNFYNTHANSNSPYRVQREVGLGRLFPG